MPSFVTIDKDCSGEVTVERSRFIAVMRHVTTEDEAATFISEKRAEHRDARHNVFAFSLSDGIARSSDDGEPHGTAGKPISDLINSSGYRDVCMVVTRYFGGVLLGTGGLVRAYSAAASEALSHAVPVHMTLCAEAEICCSYAEYDLLCAITKRFGRIVDSQFCDAVTVSVCVPVENEQNFFEELSVQFNSSLKYAKKGEKILPV